MAADDDEHLIERSTGESAVLHRGWLELRKDVVQLPDGSRATREYLRHGGAVAVVPLLDDEPGAETRLVLVRQYRYPLQKVLLEFPAGKLESGEDTLTCAMRELQEETGYVAREWAYGGEIHNAAAYSTESIWIWFARGLQPGPPRPDAGEFVETVTLPLAALEALSDRGELPDVKTQIGLFWLLRARAGKMSLPWRSGSSGAHL
ncbi:NUDIX domain-containing protein [Rubrivivax rivuli]|uniref:GDP-mannose pyrophosphatase n=1 Tax=Rubrivivax rivuli TaxID=1862385 RepID=A0A437RET5_9BURK|nr:NUDIX hydrolase [Rubrivivax rivuli]RVU45249.1 NUDIX hydrolase [Rubrivivax rivuli]